MITKYLMVNLSFLKWFVLKNYIITFILDYLILNLSIKLRRNTKSTLVKKYNKNFSTRIDEHPLKINNNTKFLHLKIDTVLYYK